MSGLFFLPTELVREIIRYLARDSLESMSLTARTFRTICEPFLLHTLRLAKLNTYQLLLQTLIASPQKAKHIKRLHVGRDTSCYKECQTAVDDSSQDASWLENIAKDLHFPSEHPLRKTLRGSVLGERPLPLAEKSGALILFLLYHLPALESLHWDQDYCEVQQAVEWSLQAPPHGQGPDALQTAIRYARLGEYELGDHDYGVLECPLKPAIFWFLLPGLQTIRLDNMTDEDDEDGSHRHDEDALLPSEISQPVTSKSSAVQTLLINNCSLKKQSLETLLRLPRALESFVIGSGAGLQTPNLTDIGTLLSYQRTSLKTLGIYISAADSAGFEVTFDRDNRRNIPNHTLGSLADFPALETLNVALWMLYGLIPWTRPAGTPLPELASLLPPNLKYFATSDLEFRLQPGRNATSGPAEFLVEQLVGVVQGLRKLEVLHVYRGAKQYWTGGEQWERLDRACEGAGVELVYVEAGRFFVWMDGEGGETATHEMRAEELSREVVGWSNVSN